MRDFITIGIDVGQKVDPTAIVVAEAELLDKVAHYRIPFLQRLPLNTPYDQVAVRLAAIIKGVVEHVQEDFYDPRGSPKVERDLTHMAAQDVAELQAKAQRRAAGRVWVLVDATEVGAAVTDVLRTQTGTIPLIGVTFLHGNKCNVSGDLQQREATLGKAYLVARLQVLLQSGRLELPDNPESAALVKELQNYEIRIDDEAVDTYGAFKVGTHDDLVTALGLACLKEPEFGWSRGAST